MNCGRDQTLGLNAKIYEAMKHKVIVIGQGYTGRLSIIRSVAAMDCEITLIALLSHYEYKAKKREKP